MFRVNAPANKEDRHHHPQIFGTLHVTKEQTDVVWLSN